MSIPGRVPMAEVTQPTYIGRMGYIILLIVGAAVVIGLFVAFAGGRSRPVGHAAGGHDVSYKEPAAESITPGDSSTASQSTADSAQKHLPPA